MASSFEYAGDTSDAGKPAPMLPDELRRELWLSRVPGRSTEEKVRYLLSHYKDCAGPAGTAVGLPGGEAPEPGRAAPIPDSQLNLTVDVTCLDCGAEGYADMVLGEDGWYFKVRPICPECDSQRIVVKCSRMKQYPGL
jgi:hypothetical protein